MQKIMKFLLTLSLLFTSTLLVHTEGNTPSDADQPRIVAGTLALAKLCDALEIPLVGVRSDQMGELPARYKDLPQVGKDNQLDYEKLAQLEPDLVLSSQALAATTQKGIENTGATAKFFTYSSIDQIWDTITQLGELTHRQEQAQALVHQLQSDLDQALADPTLASLKDKKVLILFGTKNGYQAGSSTLYLGSLLNKMGLINVADSGIPSNQSMGPFSEEAMIQADPDIIITYQWHTVGADYSALYDQMIASRPIWQETSALKNNRVYHLTTADVPINGSTDMAALVKQLQDLLLTQ